MFRFTVEAIPGAMLPEHITVRILAHSNGGQAINCGLLVLRHEEYAALYLRPPTSPLVHFDFTTTEGSPEALVESILAS